MLRLEPVQDRVQQREGPLRVKGLVGRGSIRRLQIITLFRRRKIQGNQGASAATFLRLLLVPFGCNEIVQRAQQERAEAAAVRIGGGERLAFEELRKETLGEILCVMGGMTAPS